MSKADVSSVSPSSERDASFRNSSWWPIYIMNSVNKTKLSCYTTLPNPPSLPTPTDAAPQVVNSNVLLPVNTHCVEQWLGYRRKYSLWF